MENRTQPWDTNAAAAGGGAASSPLRRKPAKFSVYQNPALSAALTATSLRPSPPSFRLLFSISSASAAVLFFLSSWQNTIVNNFKVRNAPEEVAYVLINTVRMVVGLVFIGATTAIVKAIYARRIRVNAGTKVAASLSSHQLRLLGLQSKPDKVASETPRKPPVSKSHGPSTPTEPLVPIHQLATSPSRPSLVRSDTSSSNGARSKSFGVPSKPLSSPTSYRVSPTSSQMSSVKTSPAQLLSTPWSNKRRSSVKEIITEDELEHFLADVDQKITESAEKLATPPPSRNGFSISSPSTISGSANTSGTTRTTPLRPVRMSPSSQKHTTPTKKGEGEIPSPMSMEEAIEAFKLLGIYPQIEDWRDHLRQWFSSVLLSPLLSKIQNSHTKVMTAAAKLGISITVSPVGIDSSSGAAPTISSVDSAKEWQPTFTPDEDALLNQLRGSLLQSLDASMYRLSSASQQQSPQQNAYFPIIQECVDAITEHQRLLALMKGELIKGVLPQSSIPAEYTAHRIKELADGTCLKNYEYMGKVGASDKLNKKWTLELPTDLHLLLYLFCAFLEYPKWMLHADPSTYSGAQSSKNPLFLGVLPPKERFPEKYIAVVSAVPSVVHPGATVLVIGRLCPPVCVMYWDKKQQFCLQGRTALWDSILLLCHRIKTAHGGFVRGIHLGSSALTLMPVLESEEDE